MPLPMSNANRYDLPGEIYDEQELDELLAAADPQQLAKEYADWMNQGETNA